MRTFEIYLIQQYGELPASIGARLAGLNLKEMQENGTPLLENFVDAGILSCEEVQKQLEPLKNMVKAARYISDEELSKEQLDPMPIYLEEEEKGKEEESLPRVVLKRTGLVEEFREEKLRQGVAEAPTAEPLSEETIDRILQKVKQQLLKLQAERISSDAIRRIVIQQIKEEGMSFHRPEIFDAIHNSEINRKLQTRGKLDQLTLEEAKTLLEIAHRFT